MHLSVNGNRMIGKRIHKNSFQIITDEDFLEICPLCKRNMAAVPQGAFAAKKVRKNEERLKEYNFNVEMNPTNYNSKFMDSIWGQYNRYSVHNLKKIMDSSVLTMGLSKDKDILAAQAVEKNSLSTELGSMGSAISLSPKKMYN